MLKKRLHPYTFHHVYVSWFLNLLSYRWSYMPDEAKKQKHVSPGYCSFLLHLLPKKHFPVIRVKLFHVLQFLG